jgi:hypothetical protein
LVRFPKAVSRPNAHRSGWTAPDCTEPTDHAVTIIEITIMSILEL